jgi:hypothetical protein
VEAGKDEKDALWNSAWNDQSVEIAAANFSAYTHQMNITVTSPTGLVLDLSKKSNHDASCSLNLKSGRHQYSFTERCFAERWLRREGWIEACCDIIPYDFNISC